MKNQLIMLHHKTDFYQEISHFYIKEIAIII
jgi:hypothetical protein